MFRILRKNLEVGKTTIPYEPGCQKAPEGFRGAPEIDPEKCTGCGKCVASCPTDALSVADDPSKNTRSLFLSYGDCIFCGLCGPACPYEAIPNCSRGCPRANALESNQPIDLVTLFIRLPNRMGFSRGRAKIDLKWLLS